MIKASKARHLNWEDLPTALRDFFATIPEDEEVLILRGPRLVATLLPLPTGKPTFGSAAGLVGMADDFDAPLEDFHDYQ